MTEYRYPTEEEIIAHIFEKIKMRAITFDYHSLYNEIYNKTCKDYSVSDDRSNENRLHLVIEDMKRAGLLAKGPHYTWPGQGSVENILVTPKGKEIANSGNWISPYISNDSYVAKVTNGINWISSPVIQISAEAFSCWKTGHYLASTSLIGLLCEFVIEDFVSELDPLVPDNTKTKYPDLFAAIGIMGASKRIKALQKFFDDNRRKSIVFKNTSVDIDSLISLYANQIRLIRNKASHKPAKSLSPEQVFMALQGIIDYISQLNQILTYLKNNSEVLV